MYQRILVPVVPDRVIFIERRTYTIDVFGVLKEAGEQTMQEMKARVVAAGIEVSTFVSDVLPGRVCDVVLEQAKAFDAEQIVIGTHGRRGMGRLLVGSDAEQIVRLETVPVLLVRVPQGDTVAAGTAAAKATPAGVTT